MNLDLWRCRYCDNIGHFEPTLVSWTNADDVGDFDAPHGEVAHRPLVCRLHLEDSLRDFRSTCQTPHTMLKFFRPQERGDQELVEVVKYIQTSREDLPVWTDWHDQTRLGGCCEGLRQRGYCPHGVYVTYYDTGRVDVEVKVPVATVADIPARRGWKKGNDNLYCYPLTVEVTHALRG